MKTSLLVIFTALLIGCQSSRPGAPLSAGQAGKLAVQLANESAFTLYHCQPFVTGQPAQLTGGHWRWSERQGFGHGDIHATVELAANGSTNKVSLQLLTNQPDQPFRSP